MAQGAFNLGYFMDRDERGEWWWWACDEDGEEVAKSSKYYPTREACREAINKIQSAMFADIQDVSKPSRP